MKILFCFVIVVINYNTIAQSKGNIIVSVKNIENNKGQIIAFLYKSEDGFPTDPDKAELHTTSKIDNKASYLLFENINYGKYSILVLHDSNTNNKIDTNWLGMPKEGCGVSNNAKGSFGPPKFNDAVFFLNSQEKRISIDLVY
jgi:uncharacterized protein (DUF2141 family)